MSWSELLAGQEGPLAIALEVICHPGENYVAGYAIALEVWCTLTDAGEQKWQMDTYEAITRAYYELKANYEDQIAAAAIQAGIAIRGQNPLKNRETEREELKKAVITLLTGNRFEEMGAIDTGGTSLYPEIDFDKTRTWKNFIQFFEQSIEWTNMTYRFYPYFWGRKSKWLETLQSDDPDPLFSIFLKAGTARVVVPVRKSFTEAMTLYLATGAIWDDSGQAPQVNDPLYVSIIQEIQEQDGADPKGIAEGTSWPVRLPTTLVILQEETKLPSFDLQ